jgi:hypothetical protein
MQHEHDDGHDEHKVNQTRGYVKREEPKQPQDDQHQGNCRQHVFISLHASTRKDDPESKPKGMDESPLASVCPHARTRQDARLFTSEQIAPAGSRRPSLHRFTAPPHPLGAWTTGAAQAGGVVINLLLKDAGVKAPLAAHGT